MFKERLKKERLRLGLTQEQLSKKLGISRSNLANWENGSNVASQEMLIRCSKLFRCSVDYLLGLSEYRTIGEEYDELFKDSLPSIRNGVKILNSLGNELEVELDLSSPNPPSYEEMIEAPTVELPPDGKLPKSGYDILLDELISLNLFENGKDITDEQLEVIINFIKSNKDMLKKVINQKNPANPNNKE